MNGVPQTREIEEAWTHTDTRFALIFWSFIGFSMLTMVAMFALLFI